MIFLICLAITALVILYGRDFVRKHAVALYWAAGILAAAVALGEFLHIEEYLPSYLDRLLWYPLSSGCMATALFVAVMYAGAFPQGTPGRKSLMPLRMHFSIIAGILALGHNLTAGQTHFAALFTAPETMSPNLFWAAVCSLVMILLLIPLLVTSFPAVRKKMSAAGWKKLQKLAYPFYALIYIHVLLLFMPVARAGQGRALLNITIYSVVFLTYAGLRIGTALGNRKRPLIAAAAVCIAVVFCSLPSREIAALESAPETTAPVSTSAAGLPAGKYRDGVYDGKAKGYAGTIKVRVTVESGRIAEILVLTHDEDSPYWERAYVTLDRILEAQDTEVDTVVSATQSSRGIRKAVRDALKDAEN